MKHFILLTFYKIFYSLKKLFVKIIAIHPTDIQYCKQALDFLQHIYI